MSNKLCASNKGSSYSFSCGFKTSRWTWTPRTAAEKTNVLFVAATFSSFYWQICVFASRPSRLLSYLSNMLCNNFCEHFQKLYDWLKNTVRLFSAFCVMLGKFIWVYLWFSCLRVKPYLYFVISKELKPEGKQITKKPEVI